MRRIMISHAGGRIGIGFTRALKLSREPMTLIGADADKYTLHRSPADEKVLIPRANDPDFLPILGAIAREKDVDLLWVQHEAEIAVVAEAEDRIGVLTFLPDPETVQVCRDKYASYERWRNAGLPVPASMPITSHDDLRSAFRELGPSLWLRSKSGVGGRGSLPVVDFDTATRWLDYQQGWGAFMAAERLTGPMLSWESVWYQGRLLAAQGRHRLYWELSNLTPSGVTGIGGAHEWLHNPELDELARRAVLGVSQEPHGVYSVDLTCDAQDRPRVTEINVGRFQSGGVIHAASPDTFNFPNLVIQAALSPHTVIDMPPVLNPMPGGVVLLHGVDMEPLYVGRETIHARQRELERRRTLMQKYEEILASLT